MQTLTRLTARYRATQIPRESHTVDMDCRRRMRGFTLVQSLFAIALIAIPGGLLVRNVSSLRILNASANVKSELKQILTWCELVKQDIGNYPVSLNGLPAPYNANLVWEEGHLKHATYNYCFSVLASTSDHVIIEARPCDGGASVA